MTSQWRKFRILNFLWVFFHVFFSADTTTRIPRLFSLPSLASHHFSSCSRYTLVRAYAHIARAYSASSQCHLSCHALWTPIVLSVLLTFLFLLVYFKSFLQPRGENGKAEYYDLDANRKIAHAVLLGDYILDHRDRHG